VCVCSRGQLLLDEKTFDPDIFQLGTVSIARSLTRSCTKT